MNTLEPSGNGRDPVAVATEKYLRLVEKEGAHRLTIKERNGGFRVRFAGEIVEADNLDTAILLLGKKLIRIPTFRDALGKAVTDPASNGDAPSN